MAHYLTDVAIALGVLARHSYRATREHLPVTRAVKQDLRIVIFAKAPVAGFAKPD